MQVNKRFFESELLWSVYIFILGFFGKVVRKQHLVKFALITLNIWHAR